VADMGRPFRCDLQTDGQPTVGVTDNDQIVRNARQADSGRQAIVHCIAFGEGVGTRMCSELSSRVQVTMPCTHCFVRSPTATTVSRAKSTPTATPPYNYKTSIRKCPHQYSTMYTWIISMQRQM
jgi:hypothetical protein